MPNDPISIVITAEDRYSSVLKTMSSVTKSFDKNAENLERTLHKLSGEKSVLKAETDKARKAMQDAQRQFAETGDAADGLAASLAGQEYEDWHRKLETVNQTMKTTEKQIRSLYETEKKSSGGSSRLDTVISTLAASGIGNMLGSLVQEGAETAVSSAFGAEAGSIFSSVLSTAISGAVIGSVIPVVGTAAGAGIGAVLGVVSGGIQKFEQQDEAFKSYYADLHDTVRANTTESLSRGKTLAASKETEAAAGEAERLRQEGATEEEITAVLTGTYQAAWDRLEAVAMARVTVTGNEFHVRSDSNAAIPPQRPGNRRQEVVWESCVYEAEKRVKAVRG